MWRFSCIQITKVCNKWQQMYFSNGSICTFSNGSNSWICGLDSGHHLSSAEECVTLWTAIIGQLHCMVSKSRFLFACAWLLHIQAKGIGCPLKSGSPTDLKVIWVKVGEPDYNIHHYARVCYTGMQHIAHQQKNREGSHALPAWGSPSKLHQ